MKNQLGPRPAPSQIKFTADCFEVTGTRKYWTVSNGLVGYPVRYETLEAAELAKKGTQQILECSEQIRNRIKWF